MLSDFVLCVTEVTECKCVHPVRYRAEATCLCVLVGDVGSVEVRSSLWMGWAGSASSGCRLGWFAIDRVWVPFVCPVGGISVPQLRDWSVSVSVKRQSDTNTAVSVHTSRKTSCHQTSSFPECFRLSKKKKNRWVKWRWAMQCQSWRIDKNASQADLQDKLAPAPVSLALLFYRVFFFFFLFYNLHRK